MRAWLLAATLAEARDPPRREAFRISPDGSLSTDTAVSAKAEDRVDARKWNEEALRASPWGKKVRINAMETNAKVRVSETTKRKGDDDDDDDDSVKEINCTAEEPEDPEVALTMQAQALDTERVESPECEGFLRLRPSYYTDIPADYKKTWITKTCWKAINDNASGPKFRPQDYCDPCRPPGSIKEGEQYCEPQFPGDPHGASKMCVMALPKDEQLQCNGKDFYKQKDAKEWPKCNCEHHKLALKIAATNTTFGKYLQKCISCDKST